jgi:hypothetical protein
MSVTCSVRCTGWWRPRKGVVWTRRVADAPSDKEARDQMLDALLSG